MMKVRHTRSILVLAVTSLLLWFCGYAEAGQQDEGLEHQWAEAKKEYKEGELLVKFNAGVSAEKKERKHYKHGAIRLKEFKHVKVEHIALPPGLSVEDAVKKYADDPDVEYAEPNYVVKVAQAPNDSSFGSLWGLNNTGQTGGTAGADIKAPQAWDVVTGSDKSIVAVIDTGIDYNHPDLAGNMWVNSAELNGAPGVDDDGNGHIDDIYGIDTVNDDTDPLDDRGHGTHIAGTIGAIGNNSLGVVGVNWNVKLMACKFLNSDGDGSISGAIACLDYVSTMKERFDNIIATSNSWSFPAYSQALSDAIDAQRDILFVAAASNDAVDNDQGIFYPAAYDLPNLLTIAATDHNDGKASFSNWGRKTVHIGAPGVNIFSTLPNGNYGSKSGTSMATPHVTGLVALLESQDLTRDWRSIKNLVLAGGDTTAAMDGKTITGKRINAYNSVTCANRPVLSALKYPASPRVGEPTILSALSINCANAVEPVTVTTSAGEVVTLLDDGIAPDKAAGDGQFTAAWTPANAFSYLDFASAAGTERIGVTDLIVTTVSGPASGNRGRTIAVNATVKNQGGKDAGASTVTFYLSSDATITSGDIVLGDDSVAALAAGAEQALSMYPFIPTSVANGTYYIGAIIDAHATVGNQINITTLPIDLIVSTVTGPANGNTGYPITVNATVKNQGTVDTRASASMLTFYLSTDAAISAADVALGSVSVSALASGAEQSLVATFNVPASLILGTYYIGAIADSANVELETNEGNNATAGNQIIVESGTDLVMTAVSGPATAGAQITLNGTVANQGMANAGSSYVRFRLSSDATITDSDTYLGDVYVPSLAAGASQAVTTTVTLPVNIPPGTYYIGAIADTYSTVLEASETNNGLTGNTITVDRDLVMTAVSSPPIGLTGGSITVSNTVTADANGGSSGSFDVDIYLHPASGNDIWLGQRWVGGLAPGQSNSDNTVVTIPTTVPNGIYAIRAKADKYSVVAESSESNNTTDGNQINVIGADLTISAVSAPPSGLTGGSITVSNTVTADANGGSSSGFYVGIYLHPVSGNDIWLGQRWVGGLASGQSSSENTVVTIPSNVANGTYTIRVKADSYSAVAESSESNNTKDSDSINVGGVDLTISAVSNPPSGLTGGSITVSNTVTADANGGSSSGFYVGIYLHPASGNDIWLGQRWVGGLAPGQSSSDNTVVTIPTTVANGTYTIRVKADSYSAVVESNESNNTKDNPIEVVGADLTISTVSGPPSGLVGGTITVSNTVTADINSGSSSGFYVGIYLHPASGNDIWLGQRWVGGLAPGQSSSNNTVVTIPSTVANGTYTIRVKADSYSAVVESNESNNTKDNPIEVVGADLTISTVSGPSSGLAGGTITVSNTVTADINSGSSKGFYVGIYLHPVSGSDIWLAQRWVGGLAPGQSSSENTVVTIPSTVANGIYTIRAKADKNSEVAESNESNNITDGNQITISH